MTAEMSSAPGQRPGPAGGFREALTPAWWVWLAVAGLAISFGLIAAAFGSRAALLTLVVTAVLLIGAVRWSTPVVAVGDGELRAGRAHLPVRLLGPASVLDRAGMREALGPSLDARAYLCIRGWLPLGVLVRLDDPDDPTPYWLISSRRPVQLAGALVAARDRARGASG